MWQIQVILSLYFAFSVTATTSFPDADCYNAKNMLKEETMVIKKQQQSDHLLSWLRRLECGTKPLIMDPIGIQSRFSAAACVLSNHMCSSEKEHDRIENIIIEPGGNYMAIIFDPKCRWRCSYDAWSCGLPVTSYPLLSSTKFASVSRTVIWYKLCQASVSEHRYSLVER